MAGLLEAILTLEALIARPGAHEAVGRADAIAELVEEALGAGDERYVGRRRSVGPFLGLRHLIGFGVRRLGDPGINGPLGFGEARGSELELEQLAPLGGLLVAAAGGKREPFIGLGQVFGGAEPMLGKDAEIELAVGQPVRGGFPIPFEGEGIVGAAVLAAA